MAVCDFALHGNEYPAHTFADVEMISAAQRVNCLILTYIQHTANHTAQAAAFIGNNAQVFAFIFRGNGTVQNAVCVSGNGGEGGFKVMGDVGDKFPSLFLLPLKGFRHMVKGRGQFTDFIILSLFIHADVEISICILTRCLNHFPHRVDQT